MKIAGVYFDGKTSKAHQALLELIETDWRVHLQGQEAFVYPKNSARFLDKIGTAALTLEFEDQSRFLSQDPGFLELKEKTGGGSDRVHWLENRWPVALGFLVGVIAMISAFSIFVAPVIASKIAFRIPRTVEEEVSQKTIQYLTHGKILSPSKLPLGEQLKTQLLTNRLNEYFPKQPVTILIFHGGPIKANAFALPDGSILVTDELLQLLSEDEVFATLCHEMGHVKNKHGLRSIIESSALSAILLSVSGNIDWTGLPVFLMTSGYSRKFESEADEFAIQNLSAHHLSPTLLSSALKKIDPNYTQEDVVFQWFSSHPSSKERVNHIEASVNK